MKKAVLFIFAMFIVLSTSFKAYAGDIPESALNYDDSRVYLGEVKEKMGKDIIVIQRANIKGEFTKNSEIKYKNHYADLAEGQTYLFVDFMGYTENNTEIEDNNVYSFDLDSFDLGDISKTKLVIDNIFDGSDVAVRMQEYIDNKDFEKAEKERIERKGTEKEKLFYSKNGKTDEKIEEDKESLENSEKTENVENQKDNLSKKDDDKNEQSMLPIIIGMAIVYTVFRKFRRR